MAARTSSKKTQLRELVITRIFDAPRDLVWKAWTEPESVKQWWGPKAFTAPVSKIDLRVGGEYLNCMRSPDGKDYWSKGTFQEITRFERLVMTDSFSDEKGHTVPASYYGMSQDFPLENTITATFEKHDGDQTKFTLRYASLPDQDFEDAQSGWNETLDKLVAYLSKQRIPIMLNLSSVMVGSTKPKVLAEFYEKVFGKPADWQEENWYGWRARNVYFMVGEHSEVKGKAKEPQRQILNFDSQDVKQDFERIKGLGARVVKEPYEMENTWIATFADPDGNYFQIMTPMEVSN